jgi:hypothetical protein
MFNHFVLRPRLTAADSNSSENDGNAHYVSVLRGAVKENAEQGDRAPFR